MGPGGVTISRTVSSPGGDGGSTANRGSTVQRAVDVAPTAFVATAPTPVANGHDRSQTIRRMTTGGGNGADVEHAVSDNGHDRSRQSGGGPRMPSTTEVLDRVDEMMAHLEERILEELERRGGRFTGTF
jgi:hypothetical protein